MQKLLLRRTLRDLKANVLRYLALFLLITLAMFLVIACVGSAQSVTGTVNKKAAANHLEDGQFGVFTPLKEDTIRDLQAMGVVLEENFSLDFSMEEGSTLRVLKNRRKINLVELETGRPAANPNEIVLERIYAAAHQLTVGDEITMSGNKYTVTGIGTSPDYDHCLQNFSDISSDGRKFGTAFVSDAAYRALLEGGKMLRSEEYRYSYRLEEGVTSMELKDVLLEQTINPEEGKDLYLQEMTSELTSGRNSLTNGMKELSDSSGKLQEAMAELAEGAFGLKEGIQTVSDSLEKLQGRSGNLTSGSSQVLSALKELETASEKLSFSTDAMKELRFASGELLEGMAALDAGLQELSGQGGEEAYDALIRQSLSQYNLDPSQLSPDAQLVLTVSQAYLSEVHTRLKTAAESSSSLLSSFQNFDVAMDSLSEAIEDLSSGLVQFDQAVSALREEYENLDKGIGAYTGSLNQIYEGCRKISDGAETLKESAAELSGHGEELRTGTKDLQDETQKLLDEYFPVEIENLTDFVQAEDNPRIKAANDDIAININVGLAAGLIVLILITYVISIFVIHSIDQESAMIGALYALGVTRKQLMLHYTMLPVFLCLFGGILGTLLGYSSLGRNLMAGDTAAYYSIPAVEPFYHPGLLGYGIALPPLIAFMVSRIMIQTRLNRSALSLLRKEQPQIKANVTPLKGLRFIESFQLRQFLRERKCAYAVLAGMFVSLLILALGLNCLSLCLNLQEQNRADTQFTYLYQYKYPTKTVPEGGCAAYAEGLKKEIWGYNMEVTIIGLDQDNPFFPKISSRRKNEISISSAVAEKFDLTAGDRLILSDEVEEKEYGFTVKEIVPYSVGLCCFMDLEGMRTRFGREPDYYNSVYADHALDIDKGRLVGVTTKTDVEKSSDIFIEMMTPMITMLTAVSALIFLIVLYQMMKVMIDRSAGSIALMKIFGYRDREIRKLYLDGNFLLIAAGALLLIPLAKVLMDALYPSFVANVACGVDLSWPLSLYLLVYAGILICYLLIRSLLMRRLKQTTPAEVLKDRE